MKPACPTLEVTGFGLRQDLFHPARLASSTPNHAVDPLINYSEVLTAVIFSILTSKVIVPLMC